MSAEADCDGFKGLKPPDYEPSALPEDVALCANGLFSDNTDFAKTCSSNGGVETWLSGYVQCNDGAVGALNGGQSCGGRGGFKRLMPWDYTPPTTAPPTLGESLASIVAENVTGDVLGVTAESPTVVVTIRSSESFTEGLTKDSARHAVADALEAVQGADLPPDITEVVVVIRFELVNQYGEVSEESVIVARFTRETLDRIVFDSIDPRQILLLAEGDLSVHPAFRKGDGS